MMRMRVAAAAALSLILLWPVVIRAQTACDDALREAQKSYAIGLFEDVPGQLIPCLGAPVSRAVAIQVHSLLARSYLQTEEAEKARSEVSTLLRLDSTFDPGPSPQFAALVMQVRREEQTTQVASVSKTSESLREAPATVVLITGEEIQRRGYVDLEQLLHDLPGFDISRINGGFYSLIYQRGYNAKNNDRDLLLIDGIEQNDLDFGAVYLSRQFAMSNIDRVEVIYGPASTMYGANAYTGVISIITKTPEAMIGEGKSFGLRGAVTGGGYQARSLDMTAAGKDRSDTVAWSVAAHFQENSERNLSKYDPWDFTYKNFDYKSFMHLSGAPFERAVLCGTPSPYYQCDGSGISLTDQGVTLVRKLDADATRQYGLQFGDAAKNWSIHGNVRIANLTLGFLSWRSQEGQTSGYPIPGASNWTPKNTSIYLKYNLPLGPVKINVFTRYLQSTQENDDSHFYIMHNYRNSFLNLFSLVPPCQTFFDTKPVDCAPAKPWLEDIAYSNLSNQIRSEVNGVWEPSRKLSVVAGVELAKSSIEGGNAQTSTGAGALVTVPLELTQQREHSDYAVYAQGSWRVWPSLKLTAAGRLTYNQINNRPAGERGFGSLFTPRAALVYSPGRKHFVWKAVYSEAFKDPTDSQKYYTGFTFNNAYRSNGLRPERVRNIELNGNWQPDDRRSVEGSVYQANYTDVVAYGFARHPDGTLFSDCFIGCEQWQNRDQIRVRGLQITGRYRFAPAELWANYTHTEPYQTDPNDFIGNPLLDGKGQRVKTLRIFGIASDRVNVGVDTALGNRFEAGLRLHYVGPRPLGPGTTLPVFLLGNSAIGVSANTTVDAVISYHDLLPNMTLQLSAFNLLNKQYYDPGSEPGSQPKVLQAGRTLFLRLAYALPLKK